MHLKNMELILKLRSYVSCSKKNVIRGMHFQIPPFSHKKAIACISGKALDVVVDMRKNSPTYSKVNSFLLNSTDDKLLLIDEYCSRLCCIRIRLYFNISFFYLF